MLVIGYLHMREIHICLLVIFQNFAGLFRVADCFRHADYIFHRGVIGHITTRGDDQVVMIELIQQVNHILHIVFLGAQ